MTENENHLIWLDCEMTGLDFENDKLIEIATIITDAHLNIIAEGPVLAIHQPEDLMDGMDEWCQKTHGKTGLTKRVQNSSLTEAEAENQTLEFIQQYVPEGKSPMCGNSIHQDRFFLRRYMPTLEKFFHYRNLDVSTVKVLMEHWAHYLKAGFKKDSTHQALQDIRDSIDELKYYREHFFSFVEDPINR